MLRRLGRAARTGVCNIGRGWLESPGGSYTGVHSVLLSLIDLSARGPRWPCRSENVTLRSGPGLTLNKPVGLEEDFQVARALYKGRHKNQGPLQIDSLLGPTVSLPAPQRDREDRRDGV